MYLTFYNLKDEPFRLSPEPKFLQMAHQSALRTLVSGVAHRKGLMILTGPIGVGKTTVLNTLLTLLALLAKSSIKKFPTALIINPRLSRDELLESILTDFHITTSHSSKPQRLVALQSLLLSAQRQGGTALLAVDEAHLLSADVLEELRLLMNADSYQGKLLQILLCGQPELIERLKSPKLEAVRQRIAVATALRNLTAEETQTYVAQRLRAAGLSGAFPFTTKAVEMVHLFTQGVPRLINTICDSCLTIGFERKQSEIGEGIVTEALSRNQLATLRTSDATMQKNGNMIESSAGWNHSELMVESSLARRRS